MRPFIVSCLCREHADSATIPPAGNAESGQSLGTASADAIPVTRFEASSFVDHSKTSRTFSFFSSSRLIQRLAEGVKSRP